MRIILQREAPLGRCTPGVLTIPDKGLSLYTLEDLVRPTKIKGETAIPAGTYPVRITKSHRFQKDLPILIGVPGFLGVRIHSGNTHDHTEGCILVGLGFDREASALTRSQAAMSRLMALMRGENDMRIEIRPAEVS